MFIDALQLVLYIQIAHSQYSSHTFEEGKREFKKGRKDIKGSKVQRGGKVQKGGGSPPSPLVKTLHLH